MEPEPLTQISVDSILLGLGHTRPGRQIQAKSGDLTVPWKRFWIYRT